MTSQLPEAQRDNESVVDRMGSDAFFKSLSPESYSFKECYVGKPGQTSVVFTVACIFRV